MVLKAPRQCETRPHRPISAPLDLGIAQSRPPLSISHGCDASSHSGATPLEIRILDRSSVSSYSHSNR